MTKHYVAGFMFGEGFQSVALIRKAKPERQRNKLNGVGGKVEEGEAAYSAMSREFYEETGFVTNPIRWARFAKLEGVNDNGELKGELFSLDFFAITGDVNLLRTMEAEPIEIVAVREIHPLREDMIENLPWLIALAIDYLRDGRPGFVTANYP